MTEFGTTATLALKIVLVPALIAGVTLAGRRWGQGFAGWLGSFPIVAGPVLFILALENGGAFGAEAARSALAGVAPSMVFYVVYTQLARHAAWPAVVVASLGAWFLIAAALLHLQASLWPTAFGSASFSASVSGSFSASFGWALAIAAISLFAAPRLMPAVTAAPARAAHRLELPARMLVGAAVTLASSELGRLGGPSMSGYAALFPSIGLVVASFNHAQSSAAAATEFLRGMTRGMWSVASFCGALFFALPSLPLGAAFGVAVAVALATHAAFRPRTRGATPHGLVIALLGLLFLLGGCATVNPAKPIDAVNRSLAPFTAGQLALQGEPAPSAAQAAARAEGLAAPLTQDGAVRLALLGSPSLQALLANKSAEVAEALREGRIANPVLGYERLRDHGDTEISRMLGLGLLDLLSLPQRQRVAAAMGEAAQTRLAVAVVDEVTRVRQAWVRAVAAEQRRRYAERVLQSGALSAELARRMEAAGNFNRINRARQQAFEADARAQVIVARQQAVIEREALVRALGLDDAEALRMQLPERLPDVPPTAVDSTTLSARAAERLDVQLAEASWRAATRRAGLGDLTTRTDIELSLRRDGEARGYEVEVRLPVFDAGELERRALDARSLAAANALQATLRAAGSHLRESYSGYLAAHAVARNHLDEILPLRRAIAEENLLRYNGMFIGVFELLADAREQIAAVIAAIDSQQQFWLADAALQAALVGRPLTVPLAVPAGSAGVAGVAAADH